MRIWKKDLVLQDLAAIRGNSLPTHLGIEFTELGDDFIKAKMPVNERTRQPMGILHGGASCALAETIGSFASYLATDEEHYCVGLDINTNHIRSARDGFVIATVTPLHVGSTTHVWHIPIHDEQGRLVSISRLTMIVLSGTVPRRNS